MLDKIFRRHRHHPGRDYPYSFDDMGALMYGKGSWNSNYSMKLSTVYRCVSCISDSVAQLPLEVFTVDSKGFKTKQRGHPMFGILNAKPNARMTRFVFMQRMVESILLEGNGYAYIHRDNGMVRQLIYIPSNYVTIVYPPTLDRPVEYIISGEGWSQRVQASDMIHLVNHTSDGVTGISTLEYARETLRLSRSAERHASNFFDSGCGIGGILKSSTKLTDEQAKKAKEAWNNAFVRNGGESNGVAVLGADMDYQPVTVNARDAQLLETRAFNVIDICRFFGVSPVKAFDLSKSSYSTVEATNIGFLTETLSPLLEKIELEFETKLFKEGEKVDVRFDVSQLLRADKQSLANYYRTMSNIGAITINEIRREIDLPAVEDGDTNFIQGNLQTIKNAINARPNGGGESGKLKV
ncbi:MAG: phage portal protein [Muribaculaceae bacterium]|nr:phage portal protein [Muribaculaceae bacterium]